MITVVTVIEESEGRVVAVTRARGEKFTEAEGKYCDGLAKALMDYAQSKAHDGEVELMVRDPNGRLG